MKKTKAKSPVTKFDDFKEIKLKKQIRSNQGRLESWYLRKISQGGKEILLKLTAAALPVFPMSCFKILKGIISKLESIMARFCWSSDAHQRKIHWIVWDKLFLPKALGGIGFKDMERFNQALLQERMEVVVSA